MSTDIRPFEIAATDSELADLRRRLETTRWPDEVAGIGWDQGIPLGYMQDVCDYWLNSYDWRAREVGLNRFPQFKTNIDGLDVHFIHQRSSNPDAIPVIITHGWPGSVVEFHKVIVPLAEPALNGGDIDDAFHVVCPSLPGYGFSDSPRSTGFGIEKIGAMWAELMARLGYDRYLAQGGDWGAMVTTAIGQTDTERCAGIHVNMPVAPPTPELLEDITEAEQAALDSMAHYGRWDSGYSKQQSTRPQTLGYGLTDSPSGQAAWIIEKFWSWTDCDGHPENVLTRDELLDNVMLYWLPGAAASSARLYWESFTNVDMSPVSLPTGCCIYPKEIMRASRRWAEQRFNVVHWTEQPKGGHFAAFEQPELFVEDLRKFGRLFR
jgi:pimeloyl-ACP methyl ester carboxylesterase